MTAILFNSLFPVTWVIIIAILIIIGLGWLEIRRKQRFLIARLIALVVAIVSIACLILNPILTVKKSSDIILLTKDFDKEILDSLSQANPNSQLYQLADAEAGTIATEIRNYRDLDKLKGNLFVVGQGIPPYMIDYVDKTSIQFFPVQLPDGFAQLNTTKKFIANQPATIEGVFKSPSASQIKLTGPGVTEDSVKLNAQPTQSFSLTFTPKNSGLFVYTLSASDSSGKVIHSEQLPIEIHDQKPLSILIVTDYPSAEIRFLKNFLGEQHHKVIVRYKISKDKYRTEFVNAPQQSISRLNESLLRTTDLVITDISGLSSLSNSELQSIQQAKRFGLGTLTLLNTVDFTKSVKNYLNLDIANVKADSAKLIIRNQRVKIPATAIRISSVKNLSPVQQDTDSRIVSGYQTDGLGKSGFQLLTNTYVLQLGGQKETYADLWSNLISTLARKELKKYDLSFTTPLPYYTNEPVEFKIIASGDKPTVTLDSTEVSLTEDPLIKNVWHGKIWAGQPGWHSLAIQQDSSEHNFFVSSENSLNSVRAANQQNELRKIASEKNKSTEQITYGRIPPIIFFILFLLATGFLWLAPKL